MKKIFIGIIATGFFYFLFASSNKSFDTFEWSFASLYFFGCITFCIWVVIGVLEYLKTSE